MTSTRNLITVDGESFLSADTSSELDTLIDFVLHQLSAPVDAYAVAAILESYGLRDVDAVERFGKRDIFDLAQMIYERCRSGLSQEFQHVVSRRKSPPASEPRQAVERYLRRLSFSAPWALQMVALVLRGYALGISIHFSEYQATLVVLALMFSLIVSGGFMQVLGRMLALNPPERYLGTARRIFLAVLGAGLGLALFCGVVLSFIGALFGQFLLADAPVFFLYYVTFSASWLTMAGLYALRHVRYILLATLGGLLMVAIAYDVLHWGIYAAHWLGLAAASLIAAVCAYRILWHELPAVAEEGSELALSWSALREQIPMQYFQYGALYFLFLFLDRFVGWSVRPPQALVWFRLPYELGLVVALVPFYLVTPYLEHIAERTIWRMDTIQQAFTALQIARHNRYFMRRYSDDVLRLCGVFIGAAAVIYGGLRIAYLVHLLDDPMSLWVFGAGIVGYGLLCVALLNCLFLFTMRLPGAVLNALGAGCIINAVVGFVFSRANGYWYSSLGLIAGALVFVLLTGRSVLKELQNADYYGYAAY